MCFGNSAPMQLRHRRQEVDRHRGFDADAARGDRAGPAHHAGHPHAAFPDRPFAFAEPAAGAGVVAVGQPRAVVGGEDDERVVVDAARPSAR